MTPAEAILLFGIPVFGVGWLIEPSLLRMLRRMKGTHL